MLTRFDGRTRLELLVSKDFWWRRFWRNAGAKVMPACQRYQEHLVFTPLESRIVLSATAVLDMGALLVTGDLAADQVTMEVDSAGGIQLWNGPSDTGTPISIFNHPNDPTGSTDPLMPSAITSGNIVFDLQGGDDFLRLAVPSNLNVDVLASVGSDEVQLGVSATQLEPTDTQLRIDAETVRFDPTSSVYTMNHVSLDLLGDLELGVPGTTTSIDFKGGDLSVAGTVKLLATTELSSVDGTFQFRDANLTALSAGADLTMDLGSGVVFMGSADASGGQNVSRFRVAAASLVEFGSLDANHFTVGEIDVSANQIDVAKTLEANQGNISLNGTDSVFVRSLIDAGEGNVEIKGGGGLVDLSAGTLTSLATHDAVVIQNASSVILGSVDLDQGTLRVGIDQNVLGSVSQSSGSSIVVDGLIVSSTGNVDLSNQTNRIGMISESLTNGSFTVVDSHGDLTVNGLVAKGDAVSITTRDDLRLVNDAITALAATVTLKGGNRILDLSGNDSVPNVTADSLLLSAGVGGIGTTGTPLDVSVTRYVSADTSNLSGDIRINGGSGALPLGVVTAGDGLVRLSGGTIENAHPTPQANVDAGHVELIAERGIGTLTTVRLANLSTLSADTVTGDIDLHVESNKAVYVNRLTTDRGDVSLQQRGEQVLTLNQIESRSGDIDIENDHSILIVDASSANPFIRTGETGSIHIRTTQENAEITIAGRVESVAGSIRLDSHEDITFEATGDIRSIDGDVFLHSDVIDSGNGGRIVMQDGSSVMTERGTVSLEADGNILLSSLVSNRSNGPAVVVQTHSGQVIDNGDSLVDIDANAPGGTVLIQSSGGIGASDAIEMSVDRIEATVRDAGALRIAEQDAITLSHLRTADGPIWVEANGSVVAEDVRSINRSGFDDDGRLPVHAQVSHDVSIQSVGAHSDVVVGLVQAFNGADVNLTAGDDILADKLSVVRPVLADDLALVSMNGNDDGRQAILLNTDVHQLVAQVTGSFVGDMEIHEQNSIQLAASDSGSDSDVIETTNGVVQVVAGESILVLDPDASNEGADRLLDPELVAGGVEGGIRLVADQQLFLDDGVQLHADSTVPQAVRLEASEVIFGDSIEINTGDGVGVARQFAPRPDRGLSETAFYDPRSVQATTLRGELNGFGTDVSLLVGTAGERGLALTIDWGVPTDRFQRLDNLSGDAGPVVVHHTFSEEDILASRLNSRRAATAGIVAHFSVQQHESIVVVGDSVSQGTTARFFVEGRLLSSTDNPTTFVSSDAPLLENGIVIVRVPELSLPTRLVFENVTVPVPPPPVVSVPVETTVFLSFSDLPITSITSATTVGREEYFQITAVSPDPRMESLSPAVRLPDVILEGRNLSMLFENLPDGIYEIEYVLGDGNEQLILRIELRQGVPIVPNDGLEGGPLRLQEILPIDGDPVPPATDQSTSIREPQEPAVPTSEASDFVGASAERKASELEESGQQTTLAPLSIGLATSLARYRRRRQASAAMSARLGFKRRFGRPIKRAHCHDIETFSQNQ